MSVAGYRKPIPRCSEACELGHRLAADHRAKHGRVNQDAFIDEAEEASVQWRNDGWTQLECEIAWGYAKKVVWRLTTETNGG